MQKFYRSSSFDLFHFNYGRRRPEPNAGIKMQIRAAARYSFASVQPNEIHCRKVIDRLGCHFGGRAEREAVNLSPVRRQVQSNYRFSGGRMHGNDCVTIKRANESQSEQLERRFVAVISGDMCISTTSRPRRSARPPV